MTGEQRAEGDAATDRRSGVSVKHMSEAPAVC